MTASPNPAATTHLPFFVTAPGDTDVLFNIMVVFVVASVVLTGVVFLTIHSLPERMAHKSKKIQPDLIAVLCLLALFTHEHIFWFAALLLAFIDIPDFLSPVKRIATSVEAIAGQEAGEKTLEPLYNGVLDAVPPGSSCIANVYSNNHELLASNDTRSLTRIYPHIVDTVALVHALVLRLQAIVPPLKVLVFGGH